MKDFFSRYKFDGDFLLRKVFASVLSAALRKYKEYQFVVIPLSVIDMLTEDLIRLRVW